jgi:hypothetical protein
MSVDTDQPDIQMHAWRLQWQAQETVPLDLRKEVERQSRYMRAMLIGDIVVTVVIGGGSIGWAIVSPRLPVLILAVAVWLFLTAAWSFAVANRRGAWHPAAQTTAAFLDLSLRRYRGRLRMAAFGVVLYLCEVLFGLAWVYHELAQQAPLQLSTFLISMPVGIVWACTVVFFGLVAWYGRKTRAELVYILNVRRELGEGGPDPVSAEEKTGRIFGFLGRGLYPIHRRLRRGKGIRRV